MHLQVAGSTSSVLPSLNQYRALDLPTESDNLRIFLCAEAVVKVCPILWLFTSFTPLLLCLALQVEWIHMTVAGERIIECEASAGGPHAALPLAATAAHPEHD